jgi:uncharacterized paraquat-inducible protein A
MSEFGRNFDRAQARYDAMSPDEDDEHEEVECRDCHELFEPKGSEKICQRCAAKDDQD